MTVATDTDTDGGDIAAGLRCPSCAAEVLPDDGFCEACGADLLVRRSLPVGEASAPCPDCAGTGFTDGYCDRCGRVAPSPRDRVERDLGEVAGVTDRGLRHSRNEDAMEFAVLAVDPQRPVSVIVVCDGVSTSHDPHLASAAAALAAREHLVLALRRGGEPAAATGAAITAAQNAAAELPADPRDPDNVPCTTIVTAVVEIDRVTVGWVGDARVYWLSAVPGAARRLTEDDSWAGLMISQGLQTEQEAYRAPQAHTIVRWLGSDAPAGDPHVAELRPEGPGLVLACSDGLWNYVWDAAELARLAAGGRDGLAAAAGALTAVALEAGGHDNITVVLGTCPPTSAPPDRSDDTAEIPSVDSQATQPEIRAVPGSETAGGADPSSVGAQHEQHEGSEL
jgi:PPM family protein phosphatase